MEILYYLDDLKTSMTNIQTAQTVHDIVKRYAASIGMVINNKKCAIQLNVETPLPESLQDIPRLDGTTNKYIGFEMKKGEIDRKEMLRMLEETIRGNWKNPPRESRCLKRGTGSNSSTGM